MKNLIIVALLAFYSLSVLANSQKNQEKASIEKRERYLYDVLANSETGIESEDKMSVEEWHKLINASALLQIKKDMDQLFSQWTQLNKAKVSHSVFQQAILQYNQNYKVYQKAFDDSFKRVFERPTRKWNTKEVNRFMEEIKNRLKQAVQAVKQSGNKLRKTLVSLKITALSDDLKYQEQWLKFIENADQKNKKWLEAIEESFGHIEGFNKVYAGIFRVLSTLSFGLADDLNEDEPTFIKKFFKAFSEGFFKMIQKLKSEDSVSK